MNLSYEERERRRDPVAWEKTRLVMEAATMLKLALEEQGWTQEDLARHLGRTQGIISRQLRGHENLSLGKLAELAYALGKRFEVEISDLEESCPLAKTGGEEVAPRVLPWPVTIVHPSLLEALKELQPGLYAEFFVEESGSGE